MTTESNDSLQDVCCPLCGSYNITHLSAENQAQCGRCNTVFDKRQPKNTFIP
jgi:uncharacterized paraquat-inducible protein A